MDFKTWYATVAAANNLDPDPFNPLHFYDYQRAYMSGVPAAKGHLPSQYKKLGHPRLIINGIDTRTGRPADAATIAANDAEYRRVLAARDALGF